MRSILSAFVALCFVAQVAHADTSVDLTLPAPQLTVAAVQPPSRLELERREHSARVLRNAGIENTVVGTAINLIGVALVMSNLCLSDSGSCSGRSDSGVTAGFAMIGVGYGGIFAGIPMWAVGGTRMKHAKAEIALLPTGVTGRF